MCDPQGEESSFEDVREPESWKVLGERWEPRGWVIDDEESSE